MSEQIDALVEAGAAGVADSLWEVAASLDRIAASVLEAAPQPPWLPLPADSVLWLEDGGGKPGAAAVAMQIRRNGFSGVEELRVMTERGNVVVIGEAVWLVAR